MMHFQSPLVYIQLKLLILCITLPKIVLAKQTLVQFVAPTGVAMRGVVVMVRIFIPKEKNVSSVIRKCLVQADSQKQ